MSAKTFKFPEEDAWMVARVGSILAARLVYGSDKPAARQSLLRLLFGLQRFPVITPVLNVSIRADNLRLALNGELFEIVEYSEDHHEVFRLQYFSDCHHCLFWNEFLVGDTKRLIIQDHLDDLEESLHEGAELFSEDYSNADHVDHPPFANYPEYCLIYEQ